MSSASTADVTPLVDRDDDGDHSMTDGDEAKGGNGAGANQDGDTEIKSLDSGAPASLDDAEKERERALADNVVRLLASDGKTSFDTRRGDVIISGMVRAAVSGETAAAVDVPCTQVAGPILALIVEYMKHHAGTEAPLVEKPLRARQMVDVCKDAFDAQFIDRVHDTGNQVLYDLVLAANYMDIPALLHLGAARIAAKIKGQPLDKIRPILIQGTIHEGTPDPYAEEYAKEDAEAEEEERKLAEGAQ